MARYVANVDILTETFETWLLRTNALLHSHSTEIITANSTWANTGNTSVPRNAQLYGRFVSNSIYISDSLSGGSNTSTTANLNITSNVSITGATVNSAANTRHTNTVFFEANVQANGAVVTIAPLSNAGSRATSLIVNTNTITIRSANLIVRSNTTFTAMSVVNDDTTSNTNMFGNNLNISANLVVSSLSHSIAGNTNFDAGSLFVDGTNDRVGIKTTTPDTELSIVGSANVSSSIWAGSRITSVGNTSLSSSILSVTTNTSSANVVTIAGANVNIDSGSLFVDQVNNRTGINTTAPDASLAVVGTANVSGAVRLANTLAVIGNTTLSNTIAVTGNATFSNTLTVSGNVQFNSTGLHTIAGNVNFDSGTLFVDSINNRVGFNNSSPDATISITGTANISSSMWVGGNTSLATGLVTATTNATSNVVAVVGANVNIDAGTLFVDQVNNRVGVNNTSPDASLAVTGTANVSGPSRFANTVTVIGNTTLSNTLSVAGAANLQSSANVGATLGVTGATTLANTLAVTGNTTLSNTLSVAGAANVLSTFGMTGAANALSTFGVTGLTTLSGNVNTTTANASVAINVGANVNLTTSTITVGNSSVNTVISSTLIDTDGRLVVLGNTNLSNTLTVTGNTTLSNTLSVAGAANVLSTFGVTGAANALSTFGVTGLTTLSGNVNTTTANASVAVNVGANVVANTTTLRVGNTVNYSSMTQSSIVTTGTLNVTGDAGFTSNVSVGGTLQVATLSVLSSLILEGDYAIDIVSNGNIGTSIVTPIKVYEFDKSVYRTGKVMVQVRNGANTQMSEMVVAHNDTDSYVTVYGTVASPPGANAYASPLGTFTSTINSTSNAVELFLQQTVANSSVKVVAHLIK